LLDRVYISQRSLISAVVSVFVVMRQSCVVMFHCCTKDLKLVFSPGLRVGTKVSELSVPL